MKFFDKFQETRKTKNRLPHFHQESATYFITYRLNDSIPQELMRKWKADKEIWIESHPKPWNEEIETEFHRVFSLEMDLIMDRGHGSCVLRKPDIRAILEESLADFFF
ncbi:MAG: hypothetical protein NWR03_05280 [Akkermansiaceae bacterium]|nr:hypothetical protein [Akkermansiaceae bacterium]MDP4779952.1 hypothetical protein [Akkermansiaceae bacterium]MDP4897173.1 hypothetical protein [Akkermansiaceae bacterium]